MKQSRVWYYRALLLTALSVCVLGGCTGKTADTARTSQGGTQSITDGAGKDGAGKDAAGKDAAGNGEAAPNEEAANPMKEVDNVLAFEGIGVHMMLPKEAGDPSYYIINNEVADIHFTCGGVEYTYRASSTAADFAGIFERFKDGAVTETCGSGEQKTELLIRTTESGGRLASWSWGDTNYTLYTAGSASDEEVRGLAVTLAELSENEKSS